MITGCLPGVGNEGRKSLLGAVVRIAGVAPEELPVLPQGLQIKVHWRWHLGLQFIHHHSEVGVNGEVSVIGEWGRQEQAIPCFDAGKGNVVPILPLRPDGDEEIGLGLTLEFVSSGGIIRKHDKLLHGDTKVDGGIRVASNAGRNWSANPAVELFCFKVENLTGIPLQRAHQVGNVGSFHCRALHSINLDSVRRDSIVENDALKKDASSIGMTVWNILIGHQHEGGVPAKLEERINKMTFVGGRASCNSAVPTMLVNVVLILDGEGHFLSALRHSLHVSCLDNKKMLGNCGVPSIMTFQTVGEDTSIDGGAVKVSIDTVGSGARDGATGQTLSREEAPVDGVYVMTGVLVVANPAQNVSPLHVVLETVHAMQFDVRIDGIDPFLVSNFGRVERISSARLQLPEVPTEQDVEPSINGTVPSHEITKLFV